MAVGGGQGWVWLSLFSRSLLGRACDWLSLSVDPLLFGHGFGDSLYTFLISLSHGLRGGCEFTGTSSPHGLGARARTVCDVECG